MPIVEDGGFGPIEYEGGVEGVTYCRDSMLVIATERTAVRRALQRAVRRIERVSFPRDPQSELTEVPEEERWGLEAFGPYPLPRGEQIWVDFRSEPLWPNMARHFRGVVIEELVAEGVRDAILTYAAPGETSEASQDPLLWRGTPSIAIPIDSWVGVLRTLPVTMPAGCVLEYPAPLTEHGAPGPVFRYIEQFAVDPAAEILVGRLPLDVEHVDELLRRYDDPETHVRDRIEIWLKVHHDGQLLLELPAADVRHTNVDGPPGQFTLFARQDLPSHVLAALHRCEHAVFTWQGAKAVAIDETVGHRALLGQLSTLDGTSLIVHPPRRPEERSLKRPRTPDPVVEFLRGRAAPVPSRLRHLTGPSVLIPWDQATAGAFWDAVAQRDPLEDAPLIGDRLLSVRDDTILLYVPNTHTGRAWARDDLPQDFLRAITGAPSGP